MCLSSLYYQSGSFSPLIFFYGAYTPNRPTGDVEPIGAFSSLNCHFMSKKDTQGNQLLYVHFYCRHLTGGSVSEDWQNHVTSWSRPPWKRPLSSPPSWPGDAPLGACVPPLSWSDGPRLDRCRTGRQGFIQGVIDQADVMHAHWLQMYTWLWLFSFYWSGELQHTNRSLQLEHKITGEHLNKTSFYSKQFESEHNELLIIAYCK